MSERSIPEKYQVDHLILLVGGNPLPNAVAGRLLVRPYGQITLLHSKGEHGTGEIAGRIADWLEEKGVSDIAFDEMDETSKADIVKVVKRNLKQNTKSVGLHYTSGTKKMAVHAHAVVLEARADARLSYLNSRTLCMEFDDGRSFHVGLAPEFEITIEEIFRLHGKEVQWRHDTSHMQVLPDSEKDDKGGLFEKKVGRALLSIMDEVDITDFWMNVRGKLENIGRNESPEFDVTAVRGYQLFFISCSTSSVRGRLKQRLFEAYVRARQLGGDEACIALACQRNDPTLEYEIQQTLQTEGRVRVFGRNDLDDLPNKLSSWIKEQSRHGGGC